MTLITRSQQTVLAAAQPTLPDVQKLGPQVGSRVPDFTLLDQQGQSRTLASVMGPKGLMLVFYRSADWCPYCKTQLAELQTRTAELRKIGIGLAAVSYDPVPVAADFARRRGITFPLLSDPGSATIKRSGILNTTIPEDNPQRYGIPFPGTFMLNPQGLVTSRFFEQAYQERSTVGSMLVRLGNNIDVPATKVSSPQIEITAFATDSTVAAGTRFSLVLDRRPAPGVHVYAPGVTGYKPMGESGLRQRRRPADPGRSAPSCHRSQSMRTPVHRWCRNRRRTSVRCLRRSESDQPGDLDGERAVHQVGESWRGRVSPVAVHHIQVASAPVLPMQPDAGAQRSGGGVELDEAAHQQLR